MKANFDALKRMKEEAIKMLKSILSFVGGQMTLDCIESLVKTDWPSDRYEIVMVDNGSLDDVTERVRAQYQDVRILEPLRNLGFAGGCNLGIQAVACSQGKPLRDYDHVALVNNDATVESGDCFWLDPQTLAVGRGVRTNQAGIAALSDILRPYAINVQAYDLPYWTGPAACLHLMSLASPLGPDIALIHAPLLPYALWSEMRARGWTLLHAPEDEFMASNGLSLNVLALRPRDVVMVDGFPQTRALMENAGCTVQVFDGDALCIACEGGPTCLTRPVLRA